MGSIVQRKAADGTTRYRAEIRINRKGYPHYTESKTFSTKKSATLWLANREEEIAKKPEILFGNEDQINLSLFDAISKYLDEVGKEYGRTKKYTLKLIQRLPISKQLISSIKANHIAEHVAMRKNGIESLNLSPVATSTLQHELLHIRGVLSHAVVMWDAEVDLNSFDKATAQLRKTRQISASKKRDRLPTSDELIALTEYFTTKWLHSCGTYPMHLIMWFAIFSCRREAELTRMELLDYDSENELWKIRDLKNPNGSQGNNKDFLVLEDCQKVINELMNPIVQNRMLKNGYDEKYLIPLSPKAISRNFSNACKLLGIENLRFHDLRHEGCTRLAEQGFTIPQIQHVSLHDSWSSLQRYVSIKKRKHSVGIEILNL